MKRSKPQTVYSQEFKDEAVRLALQGEKTQRAIAQDLGVNESTLRDWKAAYVARGDNSIELTPEAEVRKLRLENESLRMERDILKKAMAIFSNPHR